MATRKKASGTVKNIAALKKSSLPANFVKRNNGAWKHDDWLGFLDEIARKGYVCDPDEVGLLLESKKEAFLAK